MLRAIYLVCLLTLSAASAFSQTFGEITGAVRDPSGAVIAGATVTVTNVATNASRTTTTNDAGVYSFPALPPGPYRLKVEQKGFKTVSRTDIELQVQQSARLDIEMAVGQVTETVEVSAQSTLRLARTPRSAL